MEKWVLHWIGEDERIAYWDGENWSSLSKAEYFPSAKAVRQEIEQLQFMQCEPVLYKRATPEIYKPSQRKIIL